MTSIQMRQTITRIASSAPPYNIGIFHSRQKQLSVRIARHGAALIQTNRVHQEVARLNR